MYSIQYGASKEKDKAVYKQMSLADDLKTAIASAIQKIKNANIAIPWDPALPYPTGFLVFDAAGSTLLHPDYLAVLQGPLGRKRPVGVIGAAAKPLRPTPDRDQR